ncbi:MAG: nicotinate (nicotinamide) nucleotide adenylyltransferase [Treponema sp.]|nr:nicotinate (nicotinamide) nucleotide adenylyltransferase [Treponema sp.]
MKLGILGGSFNPVHSGHIFLADTVLSTLKLDRVVFVPAYCSPFKLDAGVQETANDRLEMLSCAVAGDSRFAIDICEIRREGVSYTADTLEDIIARYMPEGKPSLIIGDDLASDFPKWHKCEKILELADIVVARRINSSDVKYPFAHTLIKNEVMDISSQAVRQKISEGSDWRSLVPSGAGAIIEDRRLYGFGGFQTEEPQNSSEDCTQAVIQKIETVARESLNIERFLHSRSTALHASDLCRRFGLDPASGYLAGIAHDLAKQLDNKQLLKIVKSDGQAVSRLEKDKPNLLHGRAAAVLLRERFCIHNEDVLSAVALHTSGSANMCALAKVIYIADKTEASRNIEPALRKLCREGDLDSILFAVLEKTVSKLRAKDMDLSADTLKLLNKMKERKN